MIQNGENASNPCSSSSCFCCCCCCCSGRSNIAILKEGLPHVRTNYRSNAFSIPIVSKHRLHFVTLQSVVCHSDLFKLTVTNTCKPTSHNTDVYKFLSIKTLPLVDECQLEARFLLSRLLSLHALSSHRRTRITVRHV